MSSVVLSGDTSGTVTVTVPAVAGTNTATLPAATGTVMVSGNQPTFSAYASATTSVPNSTATIVQYQVKAWDTATCFNNTSGTVTLNGISVPAWSFAPNVAGYYQINAGIQSQVGVSKTLEIYLNKNGGVYSYGNFTVGDPNGYCQSCVSNIIYFNGTSDSISISAWQGTGSTTNVSAGQGQTWFSAALVRSA
jgi:hypothetical protein